MYHRRMIVVSEKKKRPTIDELFRLPPGTMGTASRIELMGNHELAVEGCKGVLEYEHNVIRFNLGHQQLKLGGRNLSIRVLERNYAEVEGYITSLEFV